MKTVAVTQERVAEKAKVERLNMTEADAEAINPSGHKRTYRADGSYEWSNTWTPNDGHGNLTPTMNAISERIAPYIEAERSRQTAIQERIERVQLKDGDGRVQYVEPHMADATAARNGWRHRWTGRATRTFRNGVWYVRDGREWRPEHEG